jgi:hypothetical protein
VSTEFTIFYAWQSDTDQERNHYFIRDALKRAIKLLRADATVDESPHPPRSFRSPPPSSPDPTSPPRAAPEARCCRPADRHGHAE